MKNISILVLAVVTLVGAPPWLRSAEDGAAVYKAKCSSCHGENGDGKPAINMPAAKGTKMTPEKLVEYLTKGEKNRKIHANPISSLTANQAKAVADYVKSMK